MKTLSPPNMIVSKYITTVISYTHQKNSDTIFFSLHDLMHYDNASILALAPNTSDARTKLNARLNTTKLYQGIRA